jgi:predicted Zn-dependent peptidase
MRSWSGPGINDADAQALAVGMYVLGGLSSSRLDNALVRGEQLAVSVSASAQQHEQLSMLQVTMDIKPGVERAKAEARFDALIAQYLAEGPSEDELRRAATSIVAGQLNALEQVGNFGGKGALLAEGELYSGNPAKFKDELGQIAALSPAQVRDAMQRWLSRPVMALAVSPGPRTEKGETMGGWGDEATSPPPKPDAKRPAPALNTAPKREFPPVAPVGDLTFPTTERFTLSNGIPVLLARRTNAPTVLVSVEFDAGFAADAQDGPGTQALLMGMLDEGTTSRNATQIAEEQERLGARIGTGSALDHNAVTMGALSANLAPSLALMADVVRNPAFAPSEVARVRDQQLAQIAQAIASPQALATRSLGPVLFGSAHPYGQPGDGLGTSASVAAMTPESLRKAQTRWLRPDLARITVVGDVGAEELRALLEASFGSWQAPATPRPDKALNAAIPKPNPRIVLIDRPNSPQSVIVAGRVLQLTGRDQGKEALDLANEVLGNGFLSRLNMDLREEKSWSYGVVSIVSSTVGPRTLSLVAPVQADRTGDSIKVLIDQMRALPGKRPVEDVEFNRVTDGNVRGLPNRFETNAQVLRALVANQRLGRPDDYQASLPSRYRAIGKDQLDQAARQWLQPDGLTFVVVGDRKLVEPQLKGLGLPIEIAPPVDSGAKAGE